MEKLYVGEKLDIDQKPDFDGKLDTGWKRLDVKYKSDQWEAGVCADFKTWSE